jgi:hypothetical protein
MKVLVTGASGFIGQACLDALEHCDITAVTMGRRRPDDRNLHIEADILLADDLLSWKACNLPISFIWPGMRTTRNSGILRSTPNGSLRRKDWSELFAIAAESMRFLPARVPNMTGQRGYAAKTIRRSPLQASMASRRCGPANQWQRFAIITASDLPGGAFFNPLAPMKTGNGWYRH